jgi:PAS domain S-box-containing protein
LVYSATKYRPLLNQEWHALGTGLTRQAMAIVGTSAEVTGGLMATSIDAPRARQSLRSEAEQRLKARDGLPPSTSLVSADALSTLYRLANDPQRAVDVIKLLHEIKVYQVELDLQFAQLEANERELAETLARYKAFYDCAPVAYLAVAFDGHIIEGNLAAAKLLGVEPYELDGRRLDSFLADDSAGALIGLLTRLRAGGDIGAGASCEVLPANSDGGARTWRISANVFPGGEAVLLVVFADSQ